MLKRLSPLLKLYSIMELKVSFKLKLRPFVNIFLYLLFDFGISWSASSLSGILRLARFFRGLDFFAGTLGAKQVKT